MVGNAIHHAKIDIKSKAEQFIRKFEFQSPCNKYETTFGHQLYSLYKIESP